MNKADTETVRTFLLEKLGAPNSRMNMADIFASVKGKLTEVYEEAQFKSALSSYIKDKTLGEFQVRKGRYGGVSLVGSETSKGTRVEIDKDNEEDKDNLDEDDEIVDSFILNLSSNYRICAPNSRNWAIQYGKKSGDSTVWVSKFYHHTLDGCIHSAAQHFLNNELRAGTIKALDLKDVADVVRQAEERIYKKLDSIREKEQTKEQKTEN